MVCSVCLFYSSAKFTNNELPVDKRIHVFAKNTGTRNGMWGTQGMRGMFTRIPGNVVIIVFRGMFEKILGNVPEDFGECY